jgi:hypothetical protein
MKILCFTDSRGIYDRSWNTGEIWPKKIKKELEKQGHNVSLILCPYKWTSTIDFIELIEKKILNISSFDIVILYTGVVEFSPRPLSNFNACYDPLVTNDGNITYKRLLYPQKIKLINNKKKFMENFIPEKSLEGHIDSKYTVKYMGESTRSLVSLNINKNIIVPYLQNLSHKLAHKFIYIGSNGICDGWEGDYLRVNKAGRPKNINIIKEYTKQYTGNFKYMINLLDWSDEEIKKYTVDNMHLTIEGSEWIYEKLIDIIHSMNNKI